MKSFDWDEIPLGEATDSAFAKILGVTRSRIFQIRKERGLAAFSNANPEDASIGERYDWEAVLLGTRPDSHIAKELGVFPRTVRLARQRRGIPAFSKKKSMDQP